MRKGGLSREMSERPPGKSPEVCLKDKRKTTVATARQTGTCELQLYSRWELSVLLLHSGASPDRSHLQWSVWGAKESGKNWGNSKDGEKCSESR